jgi:glycosyltransferase involved in cell wall biosynthesis
MKVSACIITYNHENYIRECIEGAINQIIDYEYEIVISDDKSSDNTLQICLEYASKYPNLIRILPSESNLGMIGNWIKSISNCKGEYIALCEGDDYWTDPLKLQKQVDILEVNSNLIGCFHNSEERFYRDYSKASTLYLSYPCAREFSIYDLTQLNMVPTASILFRNKLCSELFTKEFSDLSVGDWPLHLLNTRNGNYYYIPQVMSVRNLHQTSIWGMQDHKRNLQLVIGTYDQLINSKWFQDNVVEKLTKGRNALVEEIQDKKTLKTTKNSIKNFLIRIINKCF